MKRLLLLSLSLAPILGCSAVNSTARPGTWQPVGANDANLRAMIANPADLYRGASDPRTDGEIAASAVARYRAGKVRDLPDSAISKIAPISINNTASAPAGAN